MGIELAEQVRTFLGAAAIGGGLGLVYDVFRVLRRRLRLPLVGALLDLGFWLLVTVGLFCYAIAAGGGEVRIYMGSPLSGRSALFSAAQPARAAVGGAGGRWSGPSAPPAPPSGGPVTPPWEKNSEILKKTLPLSAGMV